MNVVLFAGAHGADMMTSSLWFVVQIFGLIALILITMGLVGLYANQAQQAGMTLLDDMSGHPSMAAFVEQGYRIITF